MTPSQALDLLRKAGVTFEPDEVALEERGEAVAVRLPGDRLAWIPHDASAAAHLAVENRVLALVGARCRFRVPGVLGVAPGGWTIRSMVPGTVDPYGLAQRMRTDAALIDQVAAALGAILADQHTHIVEADVAGWLPTMANWPMPRRTVDAKIPCVVTDRALLARIDRALDACDALTTTADRVLVHTDFGLHNLAFDPATGAIEGVFDYRAAAWADRHLDFRSLVFSAVPDALLDATMEAYTASTGIALSRRRILLCNAAVAVSHLAFRAGHAADEEIDGRTLAGDLRWTDWSLRRAGFSA